MSPLNGPCSAVGTLYSTWTPNHLSATITNGGVTETYRYDADGTRVARIVGGVTTVYFQDLWA
jgi:YD repeat-containing protein